MNTFFLIIAKLIFVVAGIVTILFNIVLGGFGGFICNTEDKKPNGGNKKVAHLFILASAMNLAAMVFLFCQVF